MNPITTCQNDALLDEYSARFLPSGLCEGLDNTYPDAGNIWIALEFRAFYRAVGLDRVVRKEVNTAFCVDVDTILALADILNFKGVAPRNKIGQKEFTGHLEWRQRGLKWNGFVLDVRLLYLPGKRLAGTSWHARNQTEE